MIRKFGLKSLMAVFLASMSSTSAFADAGPGTSGGGDQFTLDFVKTATQKVFPWLADNGAKLSPAVNSGEFLLALSPKDIESSDRVFESCNGTQSGREVAACYNASTGKVFLSRALYPINAESPSKIGLVAHEIFRKMGIEGDGYEVTKQMAIARQDVLVQDGSKDIVDNKCWATAQSAQEIISYTGIMKSLPTQATLPGAEREGNPACQDLKAKYYKSSDYDPNKKITILQESMDNAQAAQTAPNGLYCSNDHFIGWVTFHCTIQIGTPESSAQTTGELSAAVVNPNRAIASMMSINDKSRTRGTSSNTQKILSGAGAGAVEESTGANPSAAAAR